MTPSEVRVVVNDLFKIYKTKSRDVVALSGLNMTVEPGEIVGVVGPSGCGKTTLLNLVGGLDKPTAGRIRVSELEISAASERELEEYRLRTVGLVFQFFNLIPDMTALENVELPMRLAKGDPPAVQMRGVELLSAVGLSELALQMPDELSGGEQQRVAIACALANDPPLILADEPTGELDRETAKRVIDLLFDLVKRMGKTAIMVTHDPMVANHADRILKLEHGRVSDQYSPNEGSYGSGFSNPTTDTVQTRIK